MIYTSFKSLVATVPSIRTVMPLQPTGMENEIDDIFKLSTQGGKMVVEVQSNEKELSSDMIFE